MFLKEALGGKFQPLSSLYCGFHDIEEPIAVVTPASTCPPEVLQDLVTPFEAALQQGTDAVLNQSWWPAVGRDDGDVGSRETSLVRSLSLGAFTWASEPEVVEEPAKETAEMENEMGGVIKPSGSMVILLTKYETTLRSLGLLGAEEVQEVEEDTDFLFSRWGFHNGRLDSFTSVLEANSGMQQELCMGSSNSTGNKTKRRWSFPNVFMRKQPSTLTETCHCMPWSWRRIRSWRKCKGYDGLKDKMEDELAEIAASQQSFTDAHPAVADDTLSFNDLRKRKRGSHRTCFSWGGDQDKDLCDDEVALLNGMEDSDAKKSA